jgi:DNA (cytosine-5)-methyltransferase 1
MISVRTAFGDIINEEGKDFSSSSMKKYYDKCSPGYSFSSVHPKGSLFSLIKLHPDKVAPTLTATNAQDQLYRWDKMSGLSNNQVCLLGSYPLDYKFKTKAGYMIGMSVPPLMTYGVANQIYKQWFDTTPETKLN